MRITILVAVLALAAVAAHAAFEGAARAQTPPAVYYGAGLERGDVVTASIGGTECGSNTVDSSGAWSISVRAGDCGGKATDGALVTFAIDGRMAEQTAIWRGGWTPDNIANGIALTIVRQPPATYYGGGLEAGDVVTASIGGSRCREGVVGGSGRWVIVIPAGDCYGRAIVGALVTFAIDGRTAEQTATWLPGGVPDDTANGIALTLASALPPLATDGLRLGLRGARAVLVLDEDGVFHIYVVGAADSVNADFAERWIAGTPDP